MIVTIKGLLALTLVAAVQNPGLGRLLGTWSCTQGGQHVSMTIRQLPNGNFQETDVYPSQTWTLNFTQNPSGSWAVSYIWPHTDAFTGTAQNVDAQQIVFTGMWSYQTTPKQSQGRLVFIPGQGTMRRQWMLFENSQWVVQNSATCTLR